MSEYVITVLFFAGISAFCWVMVSRASARRKLNEPSYDLWRLKSQDREDFDAMSLAGYLVGALLFSLLTIVFVVVGVYRSVSR